MTGMKNNASKINIIATSVTGTYHCAKNQSCQDYFKYACRGSKMVAIVSDGAGSAKYGKIGAKTVCDTLCDILIAAPFADIRQKIIDALEISRHKLMFHRLNKNKNENGIIDFAATVVGVVYNGTRGLFFHIGDGAGIALLNKPGFCTVVSHPENGIFSCETYFYTMDDWKDSLRFTPFEKAKSLMLMTDGITGFAFQKDSKSLESGFIEPINRYLSEESCKTKALRALNNTLSTPRACRLNPDDKTFLWAGLK